MLISAFSRTRAFHEEIIAKTKTEGRRHRGKPEEQKQKRRLLHSFITPSASPSATANQLTVHYFVTVASIPNNSRMPAARPTWSLVWVSDQAGPPGLDWLG